MQAITWVVAATSDISWYRPVYSPDGSTLLFERTTGGQTLLYTCPADDGSNPVPFLQDVPDSLFAGMPSISQANSADLAFPGQKAVPPYNQDNNKVYISTAPSNATLLDSAQGRAPWWSPDGTLVAFESDRNGGNYALYVAQPDGSGLQQLTDPTVGAVHPKFSPDGKNIVFAGFQNPGDKKYSIGIIPFTA